MLFCELDPKPSFDLTLSLSLSVSLIGAVQFD